MTSYDDLMRFYYRRWFLLDYLTVAFHPRASERVVYNAWPAPEADGPWWPDLFIYPLVTPPEERICACGMYVEGVRNNAHSTTCQWFRW